MRCPSVVLRVNLQLSWRGPCPIDAACGDDGAVHDFHKPGARKTAVDQIASRAASRAPGAPMFGIAPLIRHH